jgi:hypothetical protein
VADLESFHWVDIQYRNSAPQYATVLTTVLRYLGRRESRVVLGLPETWLGPPLEHLVVLAHLKRRQRNALDATV